MVADAAFTSEVPAAPSSSTRNVLPAGLENWILPLNMLFS